MKNVLVLGGNHYFGKKLVKLLLDKDYKVTILNRGNRDDGFGYKVKRIKCDRHDRSSLEGAIVVSYDIVFDQCCFDYDQAKLACNVFNGKTQKYIFTSSVSVYNEYGALIKENQFDPQNYSINKKETISSNYGEAKRQAEVAFYKYARFPVTAVRFPIVLDENDATQRLQFHVNKIKNNEPIHLTNLESKISFVSADDAAKTLFELSLKDFSGPINVASNDPISLREFISHIEKCVGIKANLCHEKGENITSPYNILENWYVECSKLNELGIELTPTKEYLPEMIKFIRSLDL